MHNPRDIGTTYNVHRTRIFTDLLQGNKGKENIGVMGK